jgi:release factor glutamine methyltransferase
VQRDDVVVRLRVAGCVFAEDEAAVLIAAVASEAEFDTMVERRCSGEPLEYVIGWVEFGCIRIAVGPPVFVPRRRSELLVREAVRVLKAPAAPDRQTVVDLCCGSGAIGAAILAAVPRVELHAADIDAAALRFARRNLDGTDAVVYEGDLFDALPRSLRARVDVVVANVPYVPSSEIAMLPAEARAYEPRRALDGGSDGLSILRRVAAVAPQWLRPGGSLLIEIGRAQADAAAEAFRGSGLVPRIVADEELPATIVVGAYPGGR